MKPPFLSDPIRMRSHRCPSCRSELTAATAFMGPGKMSDHMPKADDVTVCIYCGQLLQYNRNMTVRLADAGVWDELEPDQRGQLAAVREFAKLKKQ